VKRYRSGRELLADIDRRLKSGNKRPASPLEDVIEMLAEGRHYSWTAIYLAEGQAAPARDLRVPGSDSRTVRVPLQVGQRALGILEVEPGGRPLTRVDTLLLREVAARLAAFLSGGGKYLMRRVRQMAVEMDAGPALSPKLPAASEKAVPTPRRTAASRPRR